MSGFMLPEADLLEFETRQELNNGRMAMFAIIGQIVAEMQTGKGPVEQFSG